MALDYTLKKVAEIGSKPLLTISGTEVTLFSISIFMLVIILSIIISVVLQRAFKRAFARKFKRREGTLTALLRLINYSILLIGFAIALQNIGINISALFAAGAVFAIAIGFAMQNIVENFVAGVILMIERSITPGDILEIEGHLVKVINMGIRTTVVETTRREELIIPNSIFSQSIVKNFNLLSNQFRLSVTVGVSYGSDMKKVFEVLEETAKSMPWRVPAEEPLIRLLDFGDSAVDFGVLLFTDDPWRQRRYMAELRKAIWFAFLDADITIAFNQVDIHFDPPVTQAIEGLRKIK